MRRELVAILLILACGILVVMLTARSRQRADPAGIFASFIALDVFRWHRLAAN